MCLMGITVDQIPFKSVSNNFRGYTDKQTSLAGGHFFLYFLIAGFTPALATPDFVPGFAQALRLSQ